MTYVVELKRDFREDIKDLIEEEVEEINERVTKVEGSFVKDKDFSNRL